MNPEIHEIGSLLKFIQGDETLEAYFADPNYDYEPSLTLVAAAFLKGEGRIEEAKRLLNLVAGTSYPWEVMHRVAERWLVETAKIKG